MLYMQWQISHTIFSHRSHCLLFISLSIMSFIINCCSSITKMKSIKLKQEIFLLPIHSKKTCGYKQFQETLAVVSFFLPIITTMWNILNFLAVKVSNLIRTTHKKRGLKKLRLLRHLNRHNIIRNFTSNNYFSWRLGKKIIYQ